MDRKELARLQEVVRQIESLEHALHTVETRPDNIVVAYHDYYANRTEDLLPMPGLVEFARGYLVGKIAELKRESGIE